jgi:hypothetical protein
MRVDMHDLHRIPRRFLGKGSDARDPIRKVQAIRNAFSTAFGSRSITSR